MRTKKLKATKEVIKDHDGNPCGYAYTVTAADARAFKKLPQPKGGFPKGAKRAGLRGRRLPSKSANGKPPNSSA